MEGSRNDGAEATSPVLDPDVIETLRELGGDEEPELVAELIGTFLEDAPVRIHDMRAALERQDYELLERAAHTLKSSAANLGALLLSEQARNLEAAVRAGEAVDLTELAQRCESALGEAGEALRRVIG